MKQFKFKLEKYLQWKQLKEDGVKSELARVRGLINREIRKKQAFMEEEQNIHREMRERKSSMNIFDLLGYDRYRRGLKTLIRNQDLVLEQIYIEEKKVIAKYLEAKKEREVVENLKDKRKEEYDYDLRKQEEHVLHDIGVAMSISNKEAV